MTAQNPGLQGHFYFQYVGMGVVKGTATFASLWVVQKVSGGGSSNEASSAHSPSKGQLSSLTYTVGELFNNEFLFGKKKEEKKTSFLRLPNLIRCTPLFHMDPQLRQSGRSSTP